MKILYTMKRSKDGQLRDKVLEIENLNAFIKGSDLMFNSKFISAYTLKNFETKELLFKRGNI